MTRLHLTRRRMLAAAAGSLLAAPALAQARYPMTVTDAMGRNVMIEKAPRAVILGTGFNLIALSLIHPDPVALTVGWSADMRNDNAALYEAYERRFPAIARLAVVADGFARSFAMEPLLSLSADLAIFASWQAETEPGRQAMATLDAIGIPTLVVDFSNDPFTSTPRDIRLLGRVLDCEDKAEAYARFFESRMAAVHAAAQAAKMPGPSVLMDAFPSELRSSWAYGRKGLGELIAICGGRNVADGLPPAGGTVTAEFILGADPDIYIATGSPSGSYTSFSVGPGVTAEEARESLRKSVALPHLAPIKAVRDSRVHGLWNYFNTVPLGCLAAEAVASWLLPSAAGIDPAASLDEINRRFAAVPFEGSFWTSL